jgi:hypothetical protein
MLALLTARLSSLLGGGGGLAQSLYNSLSLEQWASATDRRSPVKHTKLQPSVFSTTTTTTTKVHTRQANVIATNV